MTPALEKVHVASTEAGPMMTHYESNANDLLFDIDCPMVATAQDSSALSSSSSPQDQNCFNAFFQSIVHNPSNIFQPQPILASSYHQLLDLHSEPQPQSSSFDSSAGDGCSTARASLPSPPGMFEAESLRGVPLPFDFLPLGAAADPLPDSANANSLTSNSVLFLPPYYSTLSSQSMTCGETPTSLSNLPSSDLKQPVKSQADDSQNSLASSQSSRSNEGLSQGLLDSGEHEKPAPEESQASPQLDRALSSCALIDAPSPAQHTLDQSFSPSRSNKRSRSSTAASSSNPKSSCVLEFKGALCRLPSSWLDCHPSDNHDSLPSIPLCAPTSISHPRKMKSKVSKKHRRENLIIQSNRELPTHQLGTPCRPSVLSDKVINSNILPPTPDSSQRSNNAYCVVQADVDCGEHTAKKRRKIESIEKALEALDTLTDYLSKEVNDWSSHNGDSTGRWDQIFPHQYHSNSSLSLVSPQHFFTLGELGGRLRRRLDLERR